MKIEKNKLKGLIIILIGAVLCIVLILFMSHQLLRAGNARKSLTRTLEEHKENIKQATDVSVTDLDNQKVDLEKRFISSDQLSVVIREITNTAKKNDVKVNVITPSDQMDIPENERELLKNLHKIRLDMQVEGSFADLGAFLGELKQPEYGILRTERLSLRKKMSTPPV